MGHFLRFPPLPEVGSGSIDVDPSLWSTDQVSIGGWTLRFVMICDDLCVYINASASQPLSTSFVGGVSLSLSLYGSMEAPLTKKNVSKRYALTGYKSLYDVLQRMRSS